MAIPISLPILITSGYGPRIHPVTGEKDFHNGIDLRCDNVPLYAPYNSIVRYTGNQERGGLYIGLDHNNKVYEFLHLSRIDVTKGEYVIAGQQIGMTGNTGTSTAPHLHFAIKTLNLELNKLVPQDPTKEALLLWAKSPYSYGSIIVFILLYFLLKG